MAILLDKTYTHHYQDSLIEFQKIHMISCVDLLLLELSVFTIVLS